MVIVTGNCNRYQANQMNTVTIIKKIVISVETHLMTYYKDYIMTKPSLPIKNSNIIPLR